MVECLNKFQSFEMATSLYFLLLTICSPHQTVFHRLENLKFSRLAQSLTSHCVTTVCLLTAFLNVHTLLYHGRNGTFSSVLAGVPKR